MNKTYAGDLYPHEAWALLEKNDKAVLVDVRSEAEWAFVGTPDLTGLGREACFVEWASFPGMIRNEAFVTQVREAIGDTTVPVLFLCRSGVRSMHAAAVCSADGFGECYNIATGFEGDHDETRHRGKVAGWKVAGLPWTQN